MTAATPTAEPIDLVEQGAPAGEGLRVGSREHRARRPRARDVLRETAVEFGVCVRPLPLRRIDPATGEITIVDLACGSTRTTVCPTCARKARALRAQQAREGWHLLHDPDLTPDPATVVQRGIVTDRAVITDAAHDATEHGDPLTAQACQESADAVDDELATAGVRGTLGDTAKARRVRSTRRRQDTPDLPRRPATATTLGRVYTDPRTGTSFRPSLFVTLTLPSYGPVRRDDSMPTNPGTYDYARAARDALHFGKLLDRWCQNLRRVAGWRDWPSLRVRSRNGRARRGGRFRVSDVAYFMTCPRISPPLFFSVWMLKYHLPATRSAACASVRVASPLMGLAATSLAPRATPALDLASAGP